MKKGKMSKKQNRVYLAIIIVFVLAAVVIGAIAINSFVIQPYRANQATPSELDLSRAIEIVKEKSTTYRSNYAKYIYQSALTVQATEHSSDIRKASLDEKWSASKISSNQYSVTDTLSLTGDPLLIEVLQPDFSGTCPGGQAIFTVAINSASVTPKNDCASVLLR